MNQKPCCSCPENQDLCKGECMCHHSPKPESDQIEIEEISAMKADDFIYYLGEWYKKTMPPEPENAGITITPENIGRIFRHAIQVLESRNLPKMHHDCNQNIENNMTPAHCGICGKVSGTTKPMEDWAEFYKYYSNFASFNYDGIPLDEHVKAFISKHYVSKAEIAEVVEGSTQRPYQEGGSVEYMTKYEEGYNTALEDIKRKFNLI